MDNQQLDFFTHSTGQASSQTYHLYLEVLPEQQVRQFVNKHQQKHSMRLELRKIDTTTEEWTQHEELVLADMNETPHWCLLLVDTRQRQAESIYQDALAHKWNASLYDPQAEAVFVQFEESLLACRVAHLHYQHYDRDSRSDKVYHLYLTYAPGAEFYTVLSVYGRWGSQPRRWECSFDVRKEEAEGMWDKLHREKLRKGYEPLQRTRDQQLEWELGG